MTELKRTALFQEHVALGAMFTDFGGWNMPLKYANELDEHRAVRSAAGLFDLSHMGEIRVLGQDSATFLNTALVGNIGRVAVGKAKYSLICNTEGGIIDDLIAYRIGEEEFLVVPNAGNVHTVFKQLLELSAQFNVEVRDETEHTSLIAVQGPAAEHILSLVCEPTAREALAALPYYAAGQFTISSIDVLVARTGYTGEDGFELYVANEHAAHLWKLLLEVGAPHGLIPTGLACRDSLRLEAGMPLYGNELSLTRSPFAAGLGPVVSFVKEEHFTGRDALEKLRETPTEQVLIGLAGSGRRAARSGYPLIVNDTVVGEVSSGLLSPTLGHPIALAYVDREFSEPGTAIDVDVRGKREPFVVTTLPFYRRDK